MIDKTYVGYWWLPDDIEHKIHGTLTIFNDNKIILSTLNQFHGIDEKDYLTHSIEIGLILGFASESESNHNFSFKLVEPHLSGLNISSINSYEFTISKTLKSKFRDFSSNLKFDTLKIRPTCIDNWLDKKGYKLSYPEDRKTGLNNFQINYFHPDEIVLFEGEEFKIISGFEVSYHSPKFQFKTQQRSYIVVKYNEVKDLKNIIEDSLKIRNFFTLAVGTPIHFESTYLASSFIENGEKRRQYFSYQTKNKFDNTAVDLHCPESYNMLLGYEHVEDNIQIVLKNWLGKYDLLKFLINNFFGTLYNQYLYSDDRFLNYVFALEVYHKTKSKKKLKLQDRIRQLIDENEVLLKGLITDKEKLIKQIVETRHHFVHDSVLKPEFVIKPLDKLHKLGSILEVLIQVLLLKEIGISQDIISQRINMTLNNGLIFHNIEAL